MARVGEAPPAPRLLNSDVRMVAAVAGFHREIAERLLQGARARLAESGLPDGALDERWVPGAFELPLAALALARSGRYAAVLALGAVVRGQTPHFGYVCDVAASGLARVSLETGVPCAFGILTCDTYEQAEARAGGAVGNKGEEAADAAVAMVNLLAETGSAAAAVRAP
ncbi:MAG: 6,7-dimethyl-8-ribityllumazine synthase [Miltoncostaeaceae bacterium]|jgi:6,7-dimethyl-8-ribityllumazine synthase|nr:6,7-dimethyl-8-ribityllumazine synthase [Miltoncostaeaceae bacterium]